MGGEWKYTSLGRALPPKIVSMLEVLKGRAGTNSRGCNRLHRVCRGDWWNTVGYYSVIYGKFRRAEVFTIAFDVGDCRESS